MGETYKRVKKEKMANIRVLNKNNAVDRKIIDKLAKITTNKKSSCGGCSRKSSKK